MKNFLLFTCFILSVPSIQAQEIVCEATGPGIESSLDIGPIFCNEGPTSDGADDFLSFTVTASGPSTSFSITNLPPNTTLNYEMSELVGNEFIYIKFGDEGVFQVSVPSPDCGSVTPNFSLFEGGQNPECMADLELVSIGPIPTLGQWGIIVLSILSIIIGLRYIKDYNRRTVRTN